MRAKSKLFTRIYEKFYLLRLSIFPKLFAYDKLSRKQTSHEIDGFYKITRISTVCLKFFKRKTCMMEVTVK